MANPSQGLLPSENLMPSDAAVIQPPGQTWTPSHGRNTMTLYYCADHTGRTTVVSLPTTESGNRTQLRILREAEAAGLAIKVAL